MWPEPRRINPKCQSADRPQLALQTYGDYGWMHGGFTVLPHIDHRSLRGPLHHQREAYKEGRWWEGQARWLFLFLSEPQKTVQLSCLGPVTIHEAPGEPPGLALTRGRGVCL